MNQDERLRDLERSLNQECPGLLIQTKINSEKLREYVLLRRRIEGFLKPKRELVVPIWQDELIPYWNPYLDVEDVKEQNNHMFFDALKYLGKQRLKTPFKNVNELYPVMSAKRKHVFQSVLGTKYYTFTVNFKKIIPCLRNGWIVGYFEYTSQKASNEYGIKFLNQKKS